MLSWPTRLKMMYTLLGERKRYGKRGGSSMRERWHEKKLSNLGERPEVSINRSANAGQIF